MRFARRGEREARRPIEVPANAPEVVEVPAVEPMVITLPSKAAQLPLF